MMNLYDIDNALAGIETMAENVLFLIDDLGEDTFGWNLEHYEKDPRELLHDYPRSAAIIHMASDYIHKVQEQIEELTDNIRTMIKEMKNLEKDRDNQAGI